jgi:hypothetical protein
MASLALMAGKISMGARREEVLAVVAERYRTAERSEKWSHT